MEHDTIERRVAAYDQAAKSGLPRYGRRGRPGERTAAQAAADALGLKTTTPIIRALAAAAHADVVELADRRALLARRAQGRQGVYAGRTARIAERTADHLTELASRPKAQRPTGKRGKAVRRAADASDAVGEAARRALSPRAPRGASAEALHMERLDRTPTGRVLVTARARGLIALDEFLAAVAFRDAVELAATPHALGAIDFSREKVDGGLCATGALAAAYDGAAYLRRVAAALGENGYAFLVLVAVRGLALVEAARDARIDIRATRRRDAQAVAAARLREVLRDLQRVPETGYPRRR